MSDLRRVTFTQKQPPFLWLPRWSGWGPVNSRPLICPGSSGSAGGSPLTPICSITYQTFKKLSTSPNKIKSDSLVAVSWELSRTWVQAGAPLYLLGWSRHLSGHRGDPQSLLPPFASQSVLCPVPHSCLFSMSPLLCSRIWSWRVIGHRLQAAWFELFRLLFPLPQLCFSFAAVRETKMLLAVPATALPSAGALAQRRSSCPPAVADYCWLEARPFTGQSGQPWSPFEKWNKHNDCNACCYSHLDRKLPLSQGGVAAWAGHWAAAWRRSESQRQMGSLGSRSEQHRGNGSQITA